MSRVVTLPPADGLLPDGTKKAGWWHADAGTQDVVCDLCPRGCRIKPGNRGFCFVRENRGGELVSVTYGRSTGFCVDPIEKKPLNHFYPGSAVLSFGTAGCNLGCKFCQNWAMSKSREVLSLSEKAAPEAIAEAAKELGCRSVAFTYNDPVIWAEYAIDTAAACRSRGIKTVAVTAGYVTPAARGPLFDVMDAANVDLKGFTEHFYHHFTGSHLDPVLDTLEYLANETDVWIEITNLIIPDANDSPDDVRRLCDWVLTHLGEEVPLHFSAFHPDFRMEDRPPTPRQTLLKAYETARDVGLKYVYVGNVEDLQHQSTYCPSCGKVVIARDWYQLGTYNLSANRCMHCDAQVAGHFGPKPGDWGRKRLPVQIADYAPAPAPPSPVEGEPATTLIEPPEGAPAEEKAPGVALNEHQEAVVHRLASEIVASSVTGRREQPIDPTLGGVADVPLFGTFVTLKRRGRLRACCGSMSGGETLAQSLRHAAVITATRDVRLPPISPTELEHLRLDVSLLYNARPITGRGEDRTAEVEVGRHGLQVTREGAHGLLLPIVAAEHGWTAEQFLNQVCLKAKLPPSAWKEYDTQLVTFEATVVDAPFDPAALSGPLEPAPIVSLEDVTRLARFCRDNVVALLYGATPSAYLTGGCDGTVSGVCAAFRTAAGGEPLTIGRLSLRPGMPLQATLFGLAERMAGALRQRRFYPQQPDDLTADLTVLFDPAMHGTVAQPDLAGIDPRRRAVLVMEQAKSAWVFDPKKTPKKLLAHAADDAQVTVKTNAAVYSLATVSTSSPAEFVNVPRARTGPEIRPTAAAGTFYPGTVDEMNKALDTLFEGVDSQVQSWAAALVPHAGWIYSGRIAARVLGRVRIPETVIVLGPKHTRPGTEWAVAPHSAWSIPGGRLASDPELARELAEAIDGLELDAAAHQGEHSIEVLLPLIARLAPRSRVVGITIGGGDLDRCSRFAAGMADVLRERTGPALLIISSDMNHFASDAENRSLDRMAIEALEYLDPVELYHTVRRHHVSMCGVLPAVIVLKTLRELNALSQCEQIGYATSADVSGDTHRVVGYAGMLFG